MPEENAMMLTLTVAPLDGSIILQFLSPPGGSLLSISEPSLPGSAMIGAETIQQDQQMKFDIYDKFVSGDD